MNLDTLITNGIVVTVNGGFDVFENGAVGVRDGIIRYTGPASDISGAAATEIIDAEGGMIMPGLVNTHTHMPMSLFRGLADDLLLDQWLNEHIFPAEQAHLSHETVRSAAFLSCAEMLLSGTTTCCDGYFYEDAVAEAVAASGMRAVLGQGVIDFPAPGVADPQKNIEAALAFVKKWKHRSPLITPSIFCHSPYTCSKDTLVSARQAADAEDVLFQIHVAETRNEPSLAGLREGVSVVSYLDDLGVLDKNTLAVHAVWVDSGDISILRKRGVAVSHNPESNMKLAAGITPVVEMLGSGLVVGLGTDGCASNNNLDMFSEMGAAARLHKVVQGDPTVMDARTVIRMGTIEGARAIGMADRIGSLEPGKEADLIVLDTKKPHLFPMYHPASHVVYAARGGDVRHVMISGKWQVTDAGLLNLDAGAIIRKVNAVAERIRRTDRGENSS